MKTRMIKPQKHTPHIHINRPLKCSSVILPVYELQVGNSVLIHMNIHRWWCVCNPCVFLSVDESGHSLSLSTRKVKWLKRPFTKILSANHMAYIFLRKRLAYLLYFLFCLIRIHVLLSRPAIPSVVRPSIVVIVVVVVWRVNVCVGMR